MLYSCCLCGTVEYDSPECLDESLQKYFWLKWIFLFPIAYLCPWSVCTDTVHWVRLCLVVVWWHWAKKPCLKHQSLSWRSHFQYLDYRTHAISPVQLLSWCDFDVTRFSKLLYHVASKIQCTIGGNVCDICFFMCTLLRGARTTHRDHLA